MTAPQQYNQLTQTRYGTLIYNQFDTVVGRSIEMYGEFAEREISVFDQLVSAGHVVLDIGANIGTRTLFLARKVGAMGRVLAFEPRRLAFQTLCGNMAINSLPNVHCWNAAVGAVPGQIAVPTIDHQESNDQSTVRLGTTDEGERVPLVTIDSLQLAKCDFIRVALPGAEVDVLTGGKETITRFNPVLYIQCEQNPQTEKALIDSIDSMGYNIYWHQPEMYNSQNFAGNKNNVFGQATGSGLLCVDRRASQELVGFTPIEITRAA